MIGVVDLYPCNSRSIGNCLNQTSIPFQMINSNSQANVDNYCGFILPGVGNAQACFNNLSRSQVGQNIIKRVGDGMAGLLGICVGAQVMLSRSNEGANSVGLSLVDGVVEPVNEDNSVQVGFKSVANINNAAPGLVSEGAEYYFDHSYYCNISDVNTEVAETNCPHNYIAAFRKQHIFGVQFHPERSGKPGREYLSAFSVFCFE